MPTRSQHAGPADHQPAGRRTASGQQGLQLAKVTTTAPTNTAACAAVSGLTTVSPASVRHARADVASRRPPSGRVVTRDR